MLNAFHKVRGLRVWLVFLLVFGSVLLLLLLLLFCTPATWAATRHLQRIDFDFWRADTVMQGAYHY